jgi:hypothetical protein
MNRHPAENIRAVLHDVDLACWCPLSEPCHADVLLELANEGTIAKDSAATDGRIVTGG